ncbi:MAG: phospholipase D-like domain-containing protein [Candidatus Omnitrophica bacterium]|nr:phospholipase D-like domain-containing protein [Candidatus Omnitrophota bacterium]
MRLRHMCFALFGLMPLILLAGCNQPQPLVTKDFKVYLSRRNDIPLEITNLINQAKKEVLITSFEANLPCVFSALKAAQDRGVTVKILVDDKASETAPALPFNFIYTDSKPSSLMHVKFGVIDEKNSWLGSLNLTFNSAYQSDNDLIFFHSPEIAGYLRRAFNSLVTGKEPPPHFQGNPEIPIQIYLNPECRPVILKELKSAQKEIFFSHYVFTDSEIIQVLKEKTSRGIKVSGILERDWTGNDTAFRQLNASGASVTWDKNYYLNHYKLFLIDNKKVITGSYNPSGAAGRNQEIISVIDSPEVARFYKRNLAPQF